MMNPSGRPDFSNLSTGELVAMASSPMSAIEQMSALAELGQRMKAEQVKPPTSTVLQDMTQRRQSVQPSSGAQLNPTAAGIGAIMAAQGQQGAPPPQQQPPVQMATGGPVFNRVMPGGPFIARSPDPDAPYIPQGRAEPETPPERPRRRRGGGVGGGYLADIERMLPVLQQYYNESASMYPSTPDAAMETAGRFMGPDRLAPFLSELEGQREGAKKDRHRDRWLAVADAGFRMMGAPTLFGGLGRGGIAVSEGLSEAEKKYADANRENFRGRLGIATAQSDRDNRQGTAASSLFTAGLGARSQAAEGAVRGAVSLAEQGGADRRASAQIAAERNKLIDQFENLLDMGYSEDEARELMAQAVAGRAGTPPNNVDSYVSFAKMLSENSRAKTDFIAQYGQEAYDNLLAKAGLVAPTLEPGGIADTAAPAPTTEQATTERATTNPGAGIGAAAGAMLASGRASPRASRPPAVSAISRQEGVPTRTRDGVVIDYGNRVPGGSNRREKNGYTYEPG